MVEILTLSLSKSTILRTSVQSTPATPFFEALQNHKLTQQQHVGTYYVVRRVYVRRVTALSAQVLRASTTLPLK